MKASRQRDQNFTAVRLIIIFFRKWDEKKIVYAESLVLPQMQTEN